MTKASNPRKVPGFVRIQQRNHNFVWNVLRRHSWKLRRASQMPPLQEVKTDGSQKWTHQCSLHSWGHAWSYCVITKLWRGYNNSSLDVLGLCQENAWSLEAWEAHNVNRKGHDIDHSDKGIWNGSSDFGSRIRRECLAKADMGEHEQAYVAMVSYPTANGEPRKDPIYRKIAGNHSRYQTCECTRRFWSDKDCWWQQSLSRTTGNRLGHLHEWGDKSKEV